jgi:hypothetical protein
MPFTSISWKRRVPVMYRGAAERDCYPLCKMCEWGTVMFPLPAAGEGQGRGKGTAMLTIRIGLRRPSTGSVARQGRENGIDRPPSWPSVYPCNGAPRLPPWSALLSFFLPWHSRVWQGGMAKVQRRVYPSLAKNAYPNRPMIPRMIVRPSGRLAHRGQRKHETRPRAPRGVRRSTLFAEEEGSLHGIPSNRDRSP